VNKGSEKTATDACAGQWSNSPDVVALAAGQRLVRVVPRTCRRNGRADQENHDSGPGAQAELGGVERHGFEPVAAFDPVVLTWGVPSQEGDSFMLLQLTWLVRFRSFGLVSASVDKSDDAKRDSRSQLSGRDHVSDGSRGYRRGDGERPVYRLKARLKEADPS
jgi:hypothetical protein